MAARIIKPPHGLVAAAQDKKLSLFVNALQSCKYEMSIQAALDPP
jgi:hypothetical protein